MNIKKIITFTFLFIVIALIVGLSSCDRVSQIIQPATPQMTEVGEDISIGVVLPLTGRSSYASGPPLLQSFELALSEINAAQPNGVELRLIIEDDQSTIEGAVAAFNKLIHQDEVSVILGPVNSSQAKEVFPIAQESQVVAISPTSAARGLSAIGDFVFRVALTTDILIPRGIEVTQTQLGYQQAATLYDETDLFSTDGDEAVREVLAAKGVEVVATETFQGGDTDFSEQLTQIQSLDPDVIFVSSLPPEKPGILTQGHALGISAPFIVRTLTGGDVQAAGAGAEGAMTFIGWGTAVDTPGNQAFIENYTTQFGMAPSNFAARAYAAFYILAEAIKRAQSTDSAAIRDALASIKDFDTILGKFSFDANGDAVYDPKVLIVKDGELVLFE
ncbi:MAG: ABC transporter substrate-binding protein [Candidatus Poribacteria bacterium]|nr:ABC transporter substrate-binding protein [Candidatus Poribacteria bacterium]